MATDGAKVVSSRVRGAGGAADARAPEAGDCLVERYHLLAPLGRGAHGTVWEAHDALADTRVAVKVFGAPGAERARVQREVATLRLLRLPGIVRLLDEGVADGWSFLVTERLEGRPFPGAAGRATWEALAPTAFALLDTLARIHAAGVVHRDLKPGNVLVDARGVPTVLDFGISDQLAAHGALAHESEPMGTPAYVAPEQVRGERATPRSDLYAVGVMLYEALAGARPHEPRPRHAYLHARLTVPSRPLGEVAPEVPAGVAAVIDDLLRLDARQRPASALSARERLRGEARAVEERPRLAWVGPTAAVDALVDHATRRQSATVVGEEGMGKSRALDEACARLLAGGATVARTVASREPLASLAPVLGALDLGASATLDEALAVAADALVARLALGVVVVVDDLDRVDDASGAVLASVRGRGALLAASRGGDGEVALAPLDEAALAALFDAPERLFHLPSDAARVLAARTGGVARAVVAELAAWADAGLARRVGGRFAVDRDDVDRLTSGLRVALPLPFAPPSSHRPERASLGPLLDDLVVWVALAWPRATTDVLVEATGTARWRVEAALAELTRRGEVRASGERGYEACVAGDAEHAWTVERRRIAHRSLAAVLAPGDEGRLRHLLLAADAPAPLAAEACLVAGRWARDGQVGAATAALREALLVVRAGEAVLPPDALAAAEQLLATWLTVATTDPAPRALDGVLYELCRTLPESDALVALEQLARAAVTQRAGGERPLALLEAVAPFADVELERRRRAALAVAAHRLSRSREESVVREGTDWAAAVGDASARATAVGCEARLRYHQGRFAEAAAHHEHAAALEPWATLRLREMVHAASSWLEAHELVRCREQAERALELATACRQAPYGAVAEWLLRTSHYRAGDAHEPDAELVALAAQTGDDDAANLVALTESAIAWRLGRHDLARTWAERASASWSASGWVSGAAFMAALAAAAGSQSVGSADELLARAVRAEPAEVAVQALALLASVFPERRADCRAAADSLAAGLGVDSSRRLDVLSIDEALGMLDEGGDD